MLGFCKDGQARKNPSLSLKYINTFLVKLELRAGSPVWVGSRYSIAPAVILGGPRTLPVGWLPNVVPWAICTALRPAAETACSRWIVWKTRITTTCRFDRIRLFGSSDTDFGLAESVYTVCPFVPRLSIGSDTTSGYCCCQQYGNPRTG